VSSLLRIKTYHDTIEHQAAELAAWNRSLEARVQDQLSELERLNRLRRFLGPRIAELLISAEGEALLESHRRQIAVVACRLPGFVALAEASAPEEAIAVLRAYYAGLNDVIFSFEGTVGPLVEDRVTLLFNDPLPVDDPAAHAVRAALAIRERLDTLVAAWRKAGLDLDFGIGVDLGYATLGTIGLAGRTEYGAIGPVMHCAASLCGAASHRRILVSGRVFLASSQKVETRAMGQHTLAGVTVPVSVFAVDRMKGELTTESNAESSAEWNRESPPAPLTIREREVVELIVRGFSNREIATELVIAESTAVRHVANILNKLALKSRAQVAVWAVGRSQLAPGAS